MKRISTFCLAFIFLSLISCQKEDDKIRKVTETVGVSNITFHSADLEGYANITPGDGQVQIGFLYSTNENPSISNSKQVTVKELDSNNRYIASVNNLLSKTKYYYCSFVKQGDVLYKGDIKSFTTQNIDVKLKTGAPKDITCYSATAESSIVIDDDLNYSTLSYGIVFGTAETPDSYNSQFFESKEKDSKGTFSIQLKRLSGSTTYYYRSYAKIDGYDNYGDIISFTTLEDNIVTTGVADSLSGTVKSTLSISKDSYSTIECGICYGINENPTISNSETISTNQIDDDNSFTLNLVGIPYGLIYYRAYVKIDGIIHYGETHSFGGNEIITGDINPTNYSVKSHIRFSSGFRSIVFGICYGTNENPTIKDNTITKESVDENNDYEIELTNIPFEEIYYRAFVTIEGNTYYGQVKKCEGNKIFSGEIDTSTYGITSNIKSSRGYKSIVYGVCYGLEEEPTINAQTVTTNELDGDNNYSLTLKDIPFGGVYYRSYVIVDGAVHYGEIKSFEGNSITTGEIDTNYTIKSHIKIGSNYYTKDVTLGICYGSNDTPTVDNQTVTTNELDGDKNYTLTLKDIPLRTVYYRSFVEYDGIVYYGTIKNFVRQINSNGHEYVDLGLSVLWATCNLGAASPEDYGDYYAWGEIETYYTEGYAQSGTSPHWKEGYKGGYKWSSYKWGEDLRKLTKYNSSSSLGIVDNKTVLDPEDDVAHIKWGEDWYMPTKEEMYELLHNCTWSKTHQNGIYGYLITSKKEGYTDKSIFLPLSGYRESTSLKKVGSEGYYWSSSNHDESSFYSYYIKMVPVDLIFSVTFWYRTNGYTIRPIYR